MKKAIIGAASAMALFAGVAAANAQTTQSTTTIAPNAPANQTGSMNREAPVTCSPGTNDPRCASGVVDADKGTAAGNSSATESGSAAGSAGSSGGAAGGAAGSASGSSTGGAAASQ